MHKLVSALICGALALVLTSCENKPQFSGREGKVAGSNADATGKNGGPNGSANANGSPGNAGPSQPASGGSTGGTTSSQPLGCSLTAGASSVAPGTTVALVLDTTGNASSVMFSQSTGASGNSAPLSPIPPPFKATLKVTVASTTEYDAVVTGKDGSTAKCNATITIVQDSSPTCTLTVADSSRLVAPGTAVDLTFTVTGSADSAQLNGQNVAAASSTQHVTVNATTTYTATVTNKVGSNTCNVTVTVPPAPTCTLTAAPATIYTGATSTLTLAVNGSPTAANIDGTTIAVAGGTENVTPTATHTYTATVSALGGTSTCTAAVTVLQPIHRAGTSPFATAASQGYVWLVSMNEKVYRVKLDPANNYPVTTWTMPSGSTPGGCGHRTYVSAIGLLFTDNCNRSIFRVNDDVPTAGQAQLIWSNPDQTGTAGTLPNRMCLTSFQINGTQYIGAAYNTPTGRRFAKIPIDLTQATRINAAAAQFIDAGSGGNWGYSCFIDQQRLWFWSAVNTGVPYGLDLNSNTTMTASQAPNGAQNISTGALNNGVTPAQQPAVAVNLTKYTSYAIGGDQFGNVLAGNAVNSELRAATYDPASNAVFAPAYTAANKILVADDSCFAAATAQQCVAKAFIYLVPTDMAGNNGTTINAISSLNDGRVVGIQRGSQGNVWLLQAAVPTDISQGVTFTNIAQLKDDFYMYTDFTGASLYATGGSRTIDLTGLTGYLPGRTPQALYFNWKSSSGSADPWVGLTLGVRCYTKGNTPPATYTTIAAVGNAGTATNILTGTCTGNFDQVDLQVTPNANAGSAFSRVAQLEVDATL